MSLPPPSDAAAQAAIDACFALYDQAQRQGLGPALEAIPGLLPQLHDPGLRGEMAKLYTVYAMRRRDYQAAVAIGRIACADRPQDRQALDNLLTSLLQLDRLDEALREGAAGLLRQPESFGCHDVMTEALTRLGRLSEARGHGTLSLALKDRQSSGVAFDLSGVAVPPFEPRRRRRNIIAFSLFGAQPRYCLAAIENAIGARFLYPGWTCRFYLDASVPRATVERLEAEGAQVVRADDLPAQPFGTFWRFLVADDREIDRYVVRDADSVINTRERVAVDEWIASGRHFHVMRDEARQSELVLAGMWGGVRGALAPMRAAMAAFASDPRMLRGRTADQEFLREVVWPTIRQSVLVHDSQFAFGERRDFPAVGGLLPGRSIGDWSVQGG